MKVADRLKFTATGASAATITVGAAVTACRTLAQAISQDAGKPNAIVVNDKNVPFVVTDSAGNWESGHYTITSTTQIDQTSREASSNNGQAVTFNGTLTVYNDPLASDYARMSRDSDVTFSQSVPLTQPGTAYMEPQTNVTSGMAFAPAAGAVKGALAYARLVGNGTDTPNFSAFTPVIGSAGFDPRNGIVNVLQFLYDGHDYWYSASQAANAVAIDGTPPTASSASVANSTPAVVSITMSEAMDTNNVPAASAFAVSGHTVTGVTISPSTVINLTCSTAFVNGEAARTVSYTQPGTSNARDVAGNLLANFSGLAVTNNVAAPGDVTPPTFSSAQVTNSAPNVIVLTFNETLASVTPAAAAFAVSGGRTVTAVGAPSGATISITVNTAYANGDAITVAYTKPGTNPLQDASGNQVATFGAQTVTNNVAAGATYYSMYALNRVVASGSPTQWQGDGSVNSYNQAAGATFDHYLPANTDGSWTFTLLLSGGFHVSLHDAAQKDIGSGTASSYWILDLTFGAGTNYAQSNEAGGFGNPPGNATLATVAAKAFAAGDTVRITRSNSNSGTADTASLTVEAKSTTDTGFITVLSATNFTTAALYPKWDIAGNDQAITKVLSTGTQLRTS